MKDLLKTVEIFFNLFRSQVRGTIRKKFSNLNGCTEKEGVKETSMKKLLIAATAVLVIF